MNAIKADHWARLYCWYGLELVRRSVVLYFSDTDDADDVDFDEECLCPECGKELFPELPDDAEEEPDVDGEE